jgi:hypothetical protein
MHISCVQCDLRLLFVSNFASQCAIIMENYTNSKMTDMVLCYGSADGVGLRAQATSFLSRKVSGASCSAFANISGCCLRENGGGKVARTGYQDKTGYPPLFVL